MWKCAAPPGVLLHCQYGVGPCEYAGQAASAQLQQGRGQGCIYSQHNRTLQHSSAAVQGSTAWLWQGCPGPPCHLCATDRGRGLHTCECAHGGEAASKVGALIQRAEENKHLANAVPRVRHRAVRRQRQPQQQAKEARQHQEARAILGERLQALRGELAYALVQPRGPRPRRVAILVVVVLAGLALRLCRRARLGRGPVQRHGQLPGAHGAERALPGPAVLGGGGGAISEPPRLPVPCPSRGGTKQAFQQAGAGDRHAGDYSRSQRMRLTNAGSAGGQKVRVCATASPEVH